MFSDASGVQKTVDGTDLTDAQYAALLQQTAECPCPAPAVQTRRHHQHYHRTGVKCCDIVTVRMKMGVTTDARITEIEEIESTERLRTLHSGIYSNDL
ncbi:MAG: hypothetical protein ACLSS9_15390 [Acutalibacteraceae bacterium]